MSEKKRGLGKGLNALIDTKEDNISDKKEKTDHIGIDLKAEDKKEVFINISLIEPNKNQPRKEFNKEALTELANSIKQYGVLQPVLVRKNEDMYEIIAGERR